MRLAFVLIVFSLLAAPLAADDWPEWLGPQRDGVWREDGILERFPTGGPKIVWRAKVAAGYSGPAVAQGKVYLTDRVLAAGAKNHDEKAFPHAPKDAIPGSERILCFDQATGKELWKFEYDCPYKISYPIGPRCTPVVRDGKVYTLGAEGNLFCLDANSGKPIWSHDFKKDYGAKTSIWGHAAHPLLDGKKLICLVGGQGDEAKGIKPSAVVAFDKDTGKELWRALKTKDIGYCPPVIHEAGGRRLLFVWHSEAAAALDPETGKELWSHKIPTYSGMSISMPRVWDDKVFLTAYPQVSYVLDAADGSKPPLWKGDKKLGLYSVFSTPFVDDGHIYGSSTGGKIACVKADTGERLWENFNALRGKRADSGEFFMTKQGGRYFIFNEFGDLIIAKLSPKGYEEIDRTHLLPPTSAAFGRDVLWMVPAYAGKCVFVRNDQELLCVSLAK